MFAALSICWLSIGVSPLRHVLRIKRLLLLKTIRVSEDGFARIDAHIPNVLAMLRVTELKSASFKDYQLP